MGRQVKKRYYELALEYHPDKGKELDDLDGVPFGKSKIKSDQTMKLVHRLAMKSNLGLIDLDSGYPYPCRDLGAVIIHYCNWMNQPVK